MRHKFKIFYGQDNPDKALAGTQYRPAHDEMLVMNSAGVFYVYHNVQYYPSIELLSKKIGSYDVRWNTDTVH